MGTAATKHVQRIQQLDELQLDSAAQLHVRGWELHRVQGALRA